MPGHRTHIAFGVSSCFVLIYLLSVLMHFCPTFLQIAGCFLCAILGSTFPDIDTTSKIQRAFFMFSCCALFATIVFQSWFFFFNLSVFTIVVMFLKHRTLTHSVWFVFLLSLVPVIFSLLFSHGISTLAILGGASFGIGAFSHILLDFWT